jgi:hypothetical protein
MQRQRTVLGFVWNVELAFIKIYCLQHSLISVQQIKAIQKAQIILDSVSNMGVE